ncbi:MAG TPA: MBL fold metallo-hydrolase [Gemmatimonadaceae bacterium]
MQSSTPSLTHIGGPTALIEWRGLRMLTDPTFDPAGTAYPAATYTLRKTRSPAVPAASLPVIDAVLLSHDHHLDNLDHAGRALLGDARAVFTTTAGAERLGGSARGLEAWEEGELRASDGGVLRITGTPARHGPAHADRGPVTGFALAFGDAPEDVLYISGDTVWYEGVRQVSERFSVRTAVLFMGAARVQAVGPWALTFTAEEGVEAARAFAHAEIVPLHCEGWEHFSESAADIDRAFERAGLGARLRWPTTGEPMRLMRARAR